jgi:FkbM family methyltransferase
MIASEQGLAKALDDALHTPYCRPVLARYENYPHLPTLLLIKAASYRSMTKAAAYDLHPMRGLKRSPLASADLSSVARLLDRPVVALDVGCRDGVRPAWRELKPHALLVGFDPDPAECVRLNQAAGDPTQERYEPLALAASEGEATLYLTADPQSSSLYPPDPDAVRRYPELWRHQLRATRTIVTSTVDSWAQAADLSSIDALKIDVQGAELDVLEGAQHSLGSVRVVETEVEFRELYRGQPLFGDVDRFLRDRGFGLWRLREIYHCGLSPVGRAEPVFGVGDYVERTRLGGQIAWANAVYVRDELADASAPISWLVRARDACISSIFGFPELTEVALREAVAAAPQPAQATLAGVLERTRRRSNLRRLEDLFRRAPTHARGFVGARLGRR